MFLFVRQNRSKNQAKALFGKTNELPRSKAARYQKEFSFNPDAEHRGILLININIRRVIMFCFQCQETAKNTGCTVKGMCGKPEDLANLHDLLIYVLRGISIYGEKAKELGIVDKKIGLFIAQALFSTITNVNWKNDWFVAKIREALKIREELKARFLAECKKKKGEEFSEELHDSATWYSDDEAEFPEKAKSVGILATENEDVRSLRELLIIGLKGVAAYADHAAILGHDEDAIYSFFMEALASTTRDLSVDEMVAMVMKCGEVSVNTMALLDKANTSAYGNPEITEVNIGVRNNHGILISGHDLKDMEELLKQTDGTGVDVYTHGEMLPANYYPAFKKYDHFAGNYGNSWWLQNKEFESFNGPIILTTNCLVPLKKENTYLDRLFTTGVVGYPGAKHIPDRPEGGTKDFSQVIERAKKCDPPVEIETGKIVGGFAHNQVLALADKVVDAVKSGAIKRFIVMAGCDGRHKTRNYFTEVAQALPKDTVILTAGCAKYRYNKLDLGDIGGIPRVLDAGQCNDSYSLAVIALKLKEVFALDHINDLPISFDIGWYEQKAVAVLLALLFLGIRGIRLGPTLPAFVSPTVLNVLVDKFDIKQIGEVGADVEAMMAGK
jgi:hydroxylamine reductase